MNDSKLFAEPVRFELTPAGVEELEATDEMMVSETPEVCESGCGPATTADSEGTPLCDSCAWALDREVLEEIAKLVGFDRDQHENIVTAVREALTLALAGAVTLLDEWHLFKSDGRRAYWESLSEADARARALQLDGLFPEKAPHSFRRLALVDESTPPNRLRAQVMGLLEAFEANDGDAAFPQFAARYRSLCELVGFRTRSTAPETTAESRVVTEKQKTTLRTALVAALATAQFSGSRFGVHEIVDVVAAALNPSPVEKGASWQMDAGAPTP